MSYKNQYKKLLPFLLVIASWQSAFAYTYVSSDDIALLKKSDTSHIVLPESDILWYPQAPFANWEKQNESCEEASASLLYRNTYGVLRLGPEDFDAELDSINAFEESQGIPRNKVIKLKSGGEKAYIADLSIEQIADLLLEKYFHFKPENVFILPHPTV